MNMQMNALAPTTITASPEPRGGYIGPLLPCPTRWMEVTESNREARGLMLRHATEGMNGHSRQFHPVRGKAMDRLILMTPQTDAVIVFTPRRFGASTLDPLTTGVQVMVFRNEGHFRSCSRLREAVDEWAMVRWPGERLFVLVPGKRVVASNPGYPFRLAGWRRNDWPAAPCVVMQAPTCVDSRTEYA